MQESTSPDRSIRTSPRFFLGGICIFYVVLVLLVQAGCDSNQGQSAAATGVSLESPDNSATARETADSRIIVDRLDREVPTLPQAKRIVSLIPASTELIYAIGAGDLLVGSTIYCNFPPAANDLPKVGGGSVDSLSIESIVAAKPDLVLCKLDTHASLVDTLERYGLRVLVVEPQSLTQLFQQASWLGELTGHQTDAERFIAEMESRLQTLTKRVDQLRPPEPVTVFYEIWDDPLMTVGKGAFIDEVLGLAGLENVFADSSVSYPKIGLESLIAADPQLILMSESKRSKVDLNEVYSRPGWSDINAIKNQNVQVISADEISRCGPRVLDALEQIIEVAYSNQPPLVPTGDSGAADENSQPNGNLRNGAGEATQ